MTDRFDTWVSGAHAFMAGSGTQNNHYYYGSDDGLRPETSRPLATDHLHWLRRRFIEPTGFRHAMDVLGKKNTVLLDGAPGSGRNAAARMLLFCCAETRGALREVLPENNQGDPHLDRGHIGPSERLLLDLAAISDTAWATLHSQLPAFHDTVRSRGARLAVVLPHRLPHSIHPELGSHLAPISRPDTLTVLRRGLHFELPPDTIESIPLELQRYLGGDPPLSDVAHLCRLVAEAHRAQRTAGFAAWCAAALAAINRLPKDVAEQIVALGESRQRALLLTAAMLDEARSDAVYEACEALLDTVDFPADDRPLLEREDLSERFREIQAVPDEDGRVRFGDVDYAPAVRTHFWNHMPGLRPKLRDWVTTSVSLDSLTDRDRAVLTARLTEQILRTGKLKDLLPLVLAWTRSPGKGTRPAAAQALAYGVQHPSRGPEFRAQLYQWSLDDSISDELAKVLVDVCAGPLTERYPDQAMVRLHHLARQSRRRQGAEERLTELVIGDQRLRRRMLDRLARALPGKQHPVDIRLFIRLTHPEVLADTGSRPFALLDEPGVLDAVAAGWGSMFHDVPYPEWSEHLGEWLTTADKSQDGLRDRVLDVLIAACRGQSTALGRLYALSLHHPVEATLLHKINAAQGIRPSHPRQ